MIAEICAFLVVGSRLALTAKKTWISSRAFVAMKAEMQAHGYEFDRAQESKIRWRWVSRPQSVLADTDPEGLRTIKLAHVTAYSATVRPWKIASRIWYLLLAVGLTWLLLR